MKTKDVVEYFGSVMAVARKLRITRIAVYQWGEIVPEMRAYQIHVITDGELKADTGFYEDLEKNGETR